MSDEFDFEDVNTAVSSEVNEGLMQLGKETRKLREQMRRSSRVQKYLTASIVFLSIVQVVLTLQRIFF